MRPALQPSTAKANITLKLDVEVLREARVLAARRGISVSRLVGDQLEQVVRQASAYEQAKRRALDRMRNATPLGWERPASRDELHERR